MSPTACVHGEIFWCHICDQLMYPGKRTRLRPIRSGQTRKVRCMTCSSADHDTDEHRDERGE